LDARIRLNVADDAPRTGAELLNILRAPTDRLTVGAAGELLIDGMAASELLERFGSPLQVTVESTIRDNYRAIRDAFARAWPVRTNIMYAIKCNNAFAIRAVLSAEGAGGDCFGLGELYATLAGGADPRLLVMNGSNKTADEVDAAVQLGIIDNLDSLDEIAFLRDAARRHGRKARVNVRLKIMPDDLEQELLPAYRTPEGAAENVRRTKWGFTPAAAREVVSNLRANDDIEFLGFSTHIGHLSIAPGAFASIAREFGRAVVELERDCGVTATMLDIGGGWAQFREPSMRAYGVNRHTIDAYAHAACDALRQALGPRAHLPELWLEPGRYITGSAQLMLARVGAVKRDAGLIWIHVDASTNDLPRIESGRHWYHLLPASRMNAPLVEPVEIVGGTCFKSVLGAERRMPTLTRGDIIAVLDTGMYAEVFANQFNGLPRMATVLVNDRRAELIKRRETIADVFATQLVPSRLSNLSPAHAGTTDIFARATQKGSDPGV
jgi:diaminopimelate decarboxylase